MPSPGASAPGGELGRTPRKPGGKTRGTPAMGQQSRGASRLQISRFTRCANAYRHKTTHPAAGEATSPAICLGVEKRRHPTELSTPGERSAGRTQHASHRILSQRRTGTPPLGAELRRDKRFCGEPGGGEPHATSHTHRATRTRLTQPLPLIVFSAARCGACIQMAKIFLPTPDSRADSRLPPRLPPRLPTRPGLPTRPRTPDSRADSRLAPGLPTPAPTPDSPPDSRLPTRPGLPTPAPTPASPPTLDSRPAPGTPDSPPRTPDSRLAPDPRLPPRLPARPRPSTPAPDSRLPARPGPSTRDSRLAPDPRLPPRLPAPAPGLPTRPGTPDSRLAPDPRLPPPGLPTRPRTPGSPQTLDSRPDSRPAPGLPT
jgi:hypothetical protein